ncbi:MBL fold metallo-hydrolase [Mucilaginibacter sp. BJC16-A38]|uniref:MBL fold metallo-hydrolase RNA specificity domain-containing protein n=1 Tax=Mucilaginibacter phenanthrenivorans TaxID=1234842 RepID=UPI0021587E0C|nr:MBL fold metallo-hydrolase [Mucilaginibacter phenanthrenivorans]MCR8560784.1 MBL fold metallo-hydrolase [Mucilaginibacter phenanthrenivorans]
MMKIDQFAENDNRAVYLLSLGAAETVTGSKHLLKTPELNLLIDCGLFQGIKSMREKNWEPLPVDPSSIGAMILTHAHLDHCGYIPLLVKNGYRGKIYMSKPTRDLTELILRDSAKLQEEDAHKANKHGYTRHSPAKPLYTTADVEAALRYFEPVDAGKPYRLSDHIQFQLYPGGHIPGACSVAIDCYHKTIVFSGDIGRYHSELFPLPVHAAKADFVIMESTYGDRLHGAGNTGAELAFIIKDTIFNKGSMLIPCFAVGRAQEVMHLLYKLKFQKDIPVEIPVFLDSPMAASASKTLVKYPEWITIAPKEVSRMFSGLTINQDYEGTEKIIKRKGSKIVLAASGMLTGGRVLEYLKHYITDPKNTILIIGYQAEGTRGRALLNQTHEIKIHGQYYAVKARVKEIGGLSAHADQAELLTWLRDFEVVPPHIYLVHGEPCAQEALRVKIKDELHINPIILKQDQKEFLFDIETNMV